MWRTSEETIGTFGPDLPEKKRNGLGSNLADGDLRFIGLGSAELFHPSLQRSSFIEQLVRSQRNTDQDSQRHQSEDRENGSGPLLAHACSSIPAAPTIKCKPERAGEPFP